MNKEYFGHAALEGDSLVFNKEVHTLLGGGKIRLADINEGKFTEKEVHRRVQMGVRGNCNNNHDVAQH